MTRTAAVYSILNDISGKRYVGSSINVAERLQRHRCRLFKGIHKNIKLQNAWNKHGASSFVFEIIEIVAEDSTLRRREQHWLDVFDAVRSGYNNAPSVDDRSAVTPETRARIGAAARGKPAWNRGLPSPLRGIKSGPKSAEAKAKMSAAKKGKPPHNKGRRASPETRERNRQAKLGTTHSLETREKMSAARRGRPSLLRGRPSPKLGRPGPIPDAAARAKMRASQQRRRERERQGSAQ